MGKITCLKCGAVSYAETFEQADDQIDHSIGDLRGKPCIGSPLDITWDEKFRTDEDGNIIDSDPKPVASIVFHFGPGSKDYKPVITESKAEVIEAVEPVETESESTETEDIEPEYVPNSPAEKNTKKSKNRNANN